MDKNAIKKYAVWARNELIARVTQKAGQYEITEKKTTPADADSIGGRLLTDAEKKQRAALIKKIKADGFEQVMEEVAYTWFNRFTALRFMEVNNYLPSHIRVFTNEAGEFKPQILADAIQLEMDGLDMDKVFELKDANKTEELYKYLLIVQCNALSSILPRMFQKIEHYTELLLPDYLLREGSVIEQMIALIPEEDWTDQVQIIGWLYQYYNSEPKDEIFAAMKKNVKITRETISAATQLFTPDWIVRYMVENSLGHMWLAGHPNELLKSEWKYYLDESEQDMDVQVKLTEIKKEYADLKPEDIRCIDPCTGSGHILCYMFDVLIKIYEDYGYTAREAVGAIVEKNLWGLDIDERAAQLSYFAIMMKARQYDRRFFTRDLQPNVYAIEESNGITSAPMHDMGIELSQDEYGEAVKQAMRLVEETRDAKEYGSIIQVTPCDWELLRRFAVPRGSSESQLHMDIHGEIEASARLQTLINIGEALSQKYHIVVTNPPYMGNRGMGPKLNKYIAENYADSKSDLFSVFIERGLSLLRNNGVLGYVTMQSWLFLSSYEKLRFTVANRMIISLLQIGFNSFPELNSQVAHAASFIITNANVPDYKGNYFNLNTDKTTDDKDAVYQRKKKSGDYYTVASSVFLGFPSYNYAFWLSSQETDILMNAQSLGEILDIRQGLATGDNGRFLREWYEVDFGKIGFGYLTSEDFEKSEKKYAPYNKSGDYRKWYGNCCSIVNWEHDGAEIKNFVDDRGKLRSRPQNVAYYFRRGVTWSLISTNTFAARLSAGGFVFDVGGSSGFADEAKILYSLGLLCSKVTYNYLRAFNPTINFQIGDVKNVPFVYNEKYADDIISCVKKCIEITKKEWDSYEVSWDFMENPIVAICKQSNEKSLATATESWKKTIIEMFRDLKNNEEALNKLFLLVYGLDRQYAPDVLDKTVSIRMTEDRQLMKELISYAVGCMFGRYSLDYSGLAYAGGLWNPTNYISFMPDKDAIIPICDDEYFEDDIVGRFVKFIEVVFGKEELESNLQFISQALGGKGTSREVIRNYFLTDFYGDHLKMYQKKPIYWLFDSGKNNGFKCLVYMHRYQPDTVARIRTDYVHEQQSRYRTAITDLEQRIAGTSGSEKIKLNKELATLQAQASETRVYEEKIHHLADQMIRIDLDDGIKTNYELFKDVLAKIK